MAILHFKPNEEDHTDHTDGRTAPDLVAYDVTETTVADLIGVTWSQLSSGTTSDPRLNSKNMSQDAEAFRVLQ